MRTREIKRYGWKPSLPDPNDFKYKVTAPVELPKVVDLSDGFPDTFNQFSLGACTGNGISGLYAYKLKQQGLPFFIPSRLFIYYNERAIEGTINFDSGAMIRDGLKSLNKMGVCDEEMWKYIISKFKIQPPKECYVEGLKHTIDQYETLDNSSLFTLQQCLAQGDPFVFGFSVYESFESDEVARTGIMPMPMPDENMLGGHCVVGKGYDTTTGYVKCRNSWGEKWGDHGDFYMPFDYVKNPQLCADFWRINSVQKLEQ